MCFFFSPSSNADTCFQETAVSYTVRRLPQRINRSCQKTKMAKRESREWHEAEVDVSDSSPWTRLAELPLHNLAFNSAWTPSPPAWELTLCSNVTHTHTYTECEGRSAESGSVATDSHGSTDHLGGISLHPSNITQGFTDSLKSPLLSVCLICSPLLSKTPNKCFLRHYSAGCQIDSCTLGGTVGSPNHSLQSTQASQSYCNAPWSK